MFTLKLNLLYLQVYWKKSEHGSTFKLTKDIIDSAICAQLGVVHTSGIPRWASEENAGGIERLVW